MTDTVMDLVIVMSLVGDGVATGVKVGGTVLDAVIDRVISFVRDLVGVAAVSDDDFDTECWFDGDFVCVGSFENETDGDIVISSDLVARVGDRRDKVMESDNE